MTRRGVIAALATVPAYYATPKIEVETSTPISLLDLNMDKMADGDWALTVNYKGESVKISAREIMDALLPPKPNHCPACGFDCGQDTPAHANVIPGEGRTISREGVLRRCTKCSAAFWRD